MIRPMTTLLASVASLALGCTGAAEDPCYRNPDSCSDPSGTSTRYVVTSIELPASPVAARSLGLDLDGDGEIDNDLGAVLPGLDQLADLDLQRVLDDGIASGEIILLVDVVSTGVTDASNALGRVAVGKNPSIDPCSSAEDTICGNHLVPGTRFEIDTSRQFDAAVLGDIRSGRFVGGPNPADVEIDLKDLTNLPAFVLNADGVRADAQHTSTGIAGVIGGVVTAQQIKDVVLPALVDMAHETCQPHETRCCVPGSVGATMINLFDANSDCQLVAEELEDNNVVGGLLEPKLDLLDGGRFNPGSDGSLDSVSFGARFEAIPAEF